MWFTCFSQDSEDESSEDADYIIYDLKSSVAHIQDYNSPGNLVAMIYVETSYHKEPTVSIFIATESRAIAPACK